MTQEINNNLYHELGEKWYTAQDDPVALLRAEAKIHIPWINSKIDPNSKILDVGCGGGLFSNPLSELGHVVTGLDISKESLEIAKKYDSSNRVRYIEADARAIPLPDNSYDVIISMDFLEHVTEVQEVIGEISRLLKPGGLFFFHTFNRNPISHLVAIKFVEWFIKNTEKNLHVIDMFIKPEELKRDMDKANLKQIELKGVAPKVNKAFLKGLFTGTISDDFAFKFTKSTLISYSGIARKVYEN